MTRKCARPCCNEPSVEPHRRAAGLCKKHSLERKERQRRSAMQPNCARCSNKPRFNSLYCGPCGEAIEQQELENLERQEKELREHNLEVRVQRLEAEIRALKALVGRDSHTSDNWMD